MSKISKQAAQDAAHRIVEPINKKMVEIEEVIRGLVTTYVEEKVPVPVKKAFEKHPNYIHSISTIYLKGNGFINRVVKTTHPVPSTSREYNPTEAEAEILLKLVSQKDDLSDKYIRTKSEVIATILTLGTYKRCQEQFPEAMSFFENAPKENTALMIQLQPVREKVQCLISTDEEKECMKNL